jgi:hypothetical protein
LLLITYQSSTCFFYINKSFFHNVDNNIEPETIETREISEIKNNSEPDLHLNTHDLDTVPKEVSNIKLTVNEATKHAVPECVEETLKFNVVVNIDFNESLVLIL